MRTHPPSLPDVLSWSVALPVALLAATLAGATPSAWAQEARVGAGIEVRHGAKHADLGLPLVPGAVRREDGKDEPAGVTLAIWAGPRGLKLAVQGYSTTVPPDQVVAFYKQALAQHGAVLDCSNPPPASKDKDKEKTLRCDADETRPGTHVMKVGTPRNFHLVKVRAGRESTEFDLVKVALGGQ